MPETELSDAASKVFVEKFTFFHTEGIQTLGYLIPGPGGKLGTGERLFNWVWYCNYPDGSADLEERTCVSARQDRGLCTNASQS